MVFALQDFQRWKCKEVKMKPITITILTLIALNLLVWGAIGYINFSHPLVVTIETIPAQILKGVVIP